MRDLHAVSFPLGDSELLELKRSALLFDKFHVINLQRFLDTRDESTVADIEYLMAKDVLFDAESAVFFDSQMSDGQPLLVAPKNPQVFLSYAHAEKGNLGFATELVARMGACELQQRGLDAVAIYNDELPVPRRGPEKGLNGGRDLQTVLRVTLESLPVPDETSSWEEILEFKAEAGDKLWALRRFLRSLATEKKTGPEIRDEIEWMVHEYSKAMEVHRLKSAKTFIDVFVISPLEIIENLAKLNLAKLAKGLLSVRERKIELLEAELHAQGRECAYVFDARKKFGPES